MQSKSFAVSDAWQKFEFLEKLTEHKKDQQSLLASIIRSDKENHDTNDLHQSEIADEDVEVAACTKRLSGLTKRWVKIDKEFDTLYSQLKERANFSVFENNKSFCSISSSFKGKVD